MNRLVYLPGDVTHEFIDEYNCVEVCTVEKIEFEYYPNVRWVNVEFTETSDSYSFAVWHIYTPTLFARKSIWSKPQLLLRES